MSDSSTARSKLEFLQKEFLGDVHQLVEKLENVAGQVSAAVEQLKVVPDDNKKALTSVAVALVRAVRDLEARGVPGSRYANQVGLNDDGRKAVKTAVDEAVANWKPDLVPALHEAERHGPTALTLNEVKTEIQKLARVQAAQAQQPKQSGVDWKHVCAFVAGCLVSGVISGTAVAWALKPASVSKQGLTPDQGFSAPAGTSVEAPRKEPR